MPRIPTNAELPDDYSGDRAAVAGYRILVAAIGPGFHPDTDDYDSLPPGVDPVDVALVLRRIFATPADPYAIGLDVVHAIQQAHADDGERRCAECGESFNLTEGGNDYDADAGGPLCSRHA
jgi:hypothetical protein